LTKCFLSNIIVNIRSFQIEYKKVDEELQEIVKEIIEEVN